MLLCNLTVSQPETSERIKTTFSHWNKPKTSILWAQTKHNMKLLSSIKSISFSLVRNIIPVHAVSESHRTVLMIMIVIRQVCTAFEVQHYRTFVLCEEAPEKFVHTEILGKVISQLKPATCILDPIPTSFFQNRFLHAAPYEEELFRFLTFQ